MNMIRRRARTLAMLAPLLILVACRGEQAAPTAPAEAIPPAGTAHVIADDASSAAVELAALDERRPVPLQPMMAWHQKQNMMQHLVAIQRITGGLASQDWEEVASASALIETSPAMQRMCEHMGAGAEGFSELGLNFHQRADAIGEAARAHDGPGVLRAMSDTLQACTGCHATYRQDVVDAETWQLRTGATHQPVEGPGH